MKVTENKEVTYTVTLTEEEAHTLKGYVQNSMFQPPHEEPYEVRKLRSSIFMALMEAGVL